MLCKMKRFFYIVTMLGILKKLVTNTLASSILRDYLKIRFKKNLCKRVLATIYLNGYKMHFLMFDSRKNHYLLKTYLF